MKRITILVLLLFPIWISSQGYAAADTIKVTFNRDEGAAAQDRIIREQGSAIATMVSRQRTDSTWWITVLSNADGVRYARNHAKQNVVTTTERSVTGATLLEHFGADLTRVNVVPLMNEADTGAAHRYITFILSRSHPWTTPPVVLDATPEELQQPPYNPEWQFLQSPGIPTIRDTCCDTGTDLWIGAGLGYSPLEKVMPHLDVQWGTDRLRVIAIASYSFYEQDRHYPGDELKVTYRSILGGIAYQAILYSQFDLVAAWQRSEVYATDYGRYARKLEGPAVGIRLLVTDYLALMGLWCPAEEQLRGRDEVVWDDNRFMINLTLFTRVMGGK